MLRNRWFRLVSKIDVGKTAHIIGSASLWWLLLCLVLTMGTVPIQAWRWQLLLRVRGIAESFGWLLRAYFVSYAVGRRRRRLADLRDDPPPSRLRLAGRRLGAPRAGARRCGDAPACRRRLPARDRPLRHGRLPLDRGAVRRADGDRGRRPL